MFIQLDCPFYTRTCTHTHTDTLASLSSLNDFQFPRPRSDRGKGPEIDGTVLRRGTETSLLTPSSPPSLPFGRGRGTDRSGPPELCGGVRTTGGFPRLCPSGRRSPETSRLTARGPRVGPDPRRTELFGPDPRTRVLAQGPFFQMRPRSLPARGPAPPSLSAGERRPVPPGARHPYNPCVDGPQGDPSPVPKTGVPPVLTRNHWTPWPGVNLPRGVSGVWD